MLFVSLRIANPEPSLDLKIEDSQGVSIYVLKEEVDAYLGRFQLFRFAMLSHVI